MKLLKTEWLKLRHHNFFWIGMGLYLVCLILIITQIGAWTFKTGEGGIQLESLAALGIYKADKLWQHMTYMTAFFKIIPTFLLVFFISNEFRYKTFRQNIIDGFSVEQLYYSKVISAVGFTLLSLLTIIAAGFIVGLIYNPDAPLSDFLNGTHFFLSYFLELFCFMAFALFLTVLFKRSIITVILLLVYYYIIENILSIKYGVPAIYFLPTAASRELNLQPFTQLVPILAGADQDSKGVQTEIPVKFMLLTLVYSLMFVFGGNLILKKRDL